MFFISAASFGALSLYGYTTQRDLSPIGLVPDHGPVRPDHRPSLVNMFLKSSSASTSSSRSIGVLIFAGLTAWDTQKIKEMYSTRR